MDRETMPYSREARALKILLRLMAVAEFFAIIGVFMPAAAMASVCAWLGIGPFPEGALSPYLARHLAGMYMLHGGFTWLASTDVRRYSGLVLYLALSGLAFAVFVTVLDIQAGFPWFWWAAEGPGLGVLSVLFLVLRHRIAGQGNSCSSCP